MNDQHDNEQEDKAALQRWADAAMFRQEPIASEHDVRTGVMPKVHLLWMTPDPLGAIAAACRMYEGKPTYDLSQITDDERRHYWQQVQKTHLKAPLEFVKFHFFIEGVDRSFTHQMVRQRTAVYAQESMRFAVVEDLVNRSTLPPSLMGTGGEDDGTLHTTEEWQRNIWNETLQMISEAYEGLVESGLPAEDARGLLPHAVATRLNYCTDLRALLDHSGNRLCTQAQFHWRLVFSQISDSIRSYDPTHGLEGNVNPCLSQALKWQFEILANIFRPVCYELGRCPFQASFDRACSIRDRVELFNRHGVKSDEWHHDHRLYGSENEADSVLVKDDGEPVARRVREKGSGIVPGILPQEWAMDPTAARRQFR